jgi:predicted nucleotidyltransferase
MALRIQPSETKLAEFAARYQVAELAVFGSALRDDFSPTSDVDLLVTFLPGAEVSLFDLVDMGDELSRLLGRPVDLVPKSGIKPRIRGSVLESSRIIYAAA